MPTLQKIFNPDGNSMIEHEREDKVTSPTRLLTKESIVWETAKQWFPILVIPLKLVLTQTGAGIYFYRHSRHFLSGIYLGNFRWIPANNMQV